MSGGQKQRIAIARALIHNPRILILDEATSALDYQSEKYVQQTLDSLCKGRTTIVVSHRLSAIRNADRILYIDKGEVLEEGTHNDLLELKGQYYEMVSAGTLQSEDGQELAKINEKHESPDKTHDKQFFDGTLSELSQYNGSSGIEKPQYWAAFKRILKIARPEWIYLSFASIGALMIGSSTTIYGILLGEFYGVSIDSFLYVICPSN